MGQKSAQLLLGLDRNRSQLISLHPIHSVVHRQAFVEYREIGIHHIEDTAIATNQLSHKANGFILHNITNGRYELNFRTCPLTDRKGEQKAGKQFLIDGHRARRDGKTGDRAS